MWVAQISVGQTGAAEPSPPLRMQPRIPGLLIKLNHQYCGGGQGVLQGPRKRATEFDMSLKIVLLCFFLL